MKKKFITITDRIPLNQNSQGIFKQLYDATYKELNTNAQFMRIPKWVKADMNIDDYDRLKKMVNTNALNGAGFYMQHRDFKIANFTDVSGLVNIPIESVGVDVVHWEFKDATTYKIDLVITSKQLQILEIIGDRLLVNDGTYQTNNNHPNDIVFKKPFFIKVDDYTIEEYVIKIDETQPAFESN